MKEEEGVYNVYAVTKFAVFYIYFFWLLGCHCENSAKYHKRVRKGQCEKISKSKMKFPEAVVY